MSEKEKQTLEQIAEKLRTLPESAQQRFADMVTGAALAVEMGEKGQAAANRIE